MSNKTKGKYGEELAQEYFVQRGYKIIATNYKYSRYGEIDIIALKDSTLHFIEVKTRTSNTFGHALEAVTRDKLSKIILSMQNFLSTTNVPHKKSQIDAISVFLKNGINTIAPEFELIDNIEF